MFVVLFDYFLCKKFNGVSLGVKKNSRLGAFFMMCNCQNSLERVLPVFLCLQSHW